MLSGERADASNTAAWVALNTTGYRFAQTSNQDRWAYTSRFDYVINPATRFIVYNYKKELLQRPTWTMGRRHLTPFGFRMPSVSPGTYHGPSYNFSNEIRGGYQEASTFDPRTSSPNDFFPTLALIGGRNPPSNSKAATQKSITCRTTPPIPETTLSALVVPDKFKVSRLVRRHLPARQFHICRRQGTTPAFSLTHSTTRRGVSRPPGKLRQHCATRGGEQPAHALGGTVGSGSLFNVEDKTSGFNQTPRLFAISPVTVWVPVSQWRFRPGWVEPRLVTAVHRLRSKRPGAGAVFGPRRRLSHSESD